MLDLLSLLAAREGHVARQASDGAWDREARAVMQAASAQGTIVREEGLIYLDVRDLQTLRWRIEHHHDAQRHAFAQHAA